MEDVEKDKQRAEVFDALGHPTRIVILKALSEGAMGFAELKKRIGIESSGHLQHHLNKLDGLIKTDDHGKYCLSDQGKDALLSVHTVEEMATSGEKATGSVRAHGWSNKKVLKSVVAMLVVLLIASSSVAILEYNQISQLQSEISALKNELSPGSNVVWEHEFGVNIADFAVADEKVFTMTFDGDLYCLDQQGGQALWSRSLGGYVMWSKLIAVADGKVFTGSRGSIVSCLSAATGEVLWQFGANVSSSIAFKSPPEFSVTDGKVFTTGDGFYVLNAIDGKLLWEYLDYYSVPNFVRNWAVADDRVFAGGWNHSSDNLFCFNADTGAILWQRPMSINSPPIVDNGHVFVWNYDNGSSVLCLDELSGLPMWEFDVGNTVFQPAVADGLLLFGASNDNFYALSEEGTLKWRYESKHLTSNYPAAAAPLVTNDKVIIGCEAGYVTLLTLSDGQLVWRTPVSANVGSLVVDSNT
ncbi:PQQ-binding-like beta-propeller repeat protein, partial [Candidatus Bathyarchaeota archaeon]|nr:PQQ-binding-like beta-propeller repeat protein [Candidatus Bathyarchaeota archaeon]